MSAAVVHLPVVVRRGRKVTKGQVASVTVIYSATRPAEDSQESRGEKMADLLAQRAIRKQQERRDYEAWIDASPTVRRFPQAARYRTRAEIERLKSGPPLQG